MAHHNTVFSQTLKLIPRHEFGPLAQNHHQGQKMREMTRWSQFVSLSLAQLAGRVGLRDVVSNLKAQTSKHYVFSTNAFHLAAKTIVAIYKERRQIELFFKWIKHNLKIKSFMGTSRNTVLMQIRLQLA